ncbi:molybdopterin-guanine dinucleotide biosynthesis protein A [Cerasibacillus quisquiliarum]|uniref:Probable molybdenum cofactor guanylyltransferase n=1 Tax=Cerasibacillus quisquiliarum TaxID=227865 RepID=A0A511UXP5_9BACI|nr:molybdenum cofactor guanylyltransferase [Cerasibacillus quisquiliarum]MBB5145991.1 molybdopterin-guanine dinucleotide biosynthesis protein A [Cerasibacillus quisquiliarum]GEN30561.1 putative molybdenum cofactor guanylyltransferase [Cerasibacillus quisquiliarum]
MEFSSVILAGGQSSRMGTNKALLKLNNEFVIEKILKELRQLSQEVYIVSNDTKIYDFLNVPVIRDRYPGKGPLAGIETALYHIDKDIVIISPCDTPFIHKEVYQHLLNKLDTYDAVIPYVNNRPQPLSGIYKKNVLPVVQKQLQLNNLKVRSFFSKINVKYVYDFGQIADGIVEKHFFNMNYPDEYNRAKSF